MAVAQQGAGVQQTCVVVCPAEGWLTVFIVFQAKGFTVVVTAAKLQLTAGYSAQKVTVLTVLAVVATTVTTVQKP